MIKTITTNYIPTKTLCHNIKNYLNQDIFLVLQKLNEDLEEKIDFQIISPNDKMIITEKNFYKCRILDRINTINQIQKNNYKSKKYCNLNNIILVFNLLWESINGQLDYD